MPLRRAAGGSHNQVQQPDASLNFSLPRQRRGPALCERVRERSDRPYTPSCPTVTANRSAQAAPAALAHPLRDGKEDSEHRGFLPRRHAAGIISPPPAASEAMPLRRAWVGRGAGGKPKKNRPIQNPSLPSLVGTAPVRPGRTARRFAPARPSAPARSSSPARRRTALAPPSAPAPSPNPHTAGWTPPIAAPEAHLRRWPIPCGMGRKIRNNAGFCRAAMQQASSPPPAASGAPPHVPAFSGAAPVLSTVFHRVTPFSASARCAPLLPCADGGVHAAPSSSSAESTAPARGRRIARFLRAGRPAPPSPCAGTPPCPFLRRAHALPGAPHPPLPPLRARFQALNVLSNPAAKESARLFGP